MSDLARFLSQTKKGAAQSSDKKTQPRSIATEAPAAGNRAIGFKYTLGLENDFGGEMKE